MQEKNRVLVEHFMVRQTIEIEMKMDETIYVYIRLRCRKEEIEIKGSDE